MKPVIVETGQNLNDMAAQYYGTPEALVTICDDNNLDYDADLNGGQTLLIREPGVDPIPYRNDVVVAYYLQNNTAINSGQ